MRYFHRLAKLFILASIAAGSGMGCIPAEPPPDQVPDTPDVPLEPLSNPEQVDELVQDWLELARNPREGVLDTRPQAIARDLASIGPAALMPMLDIVADEDLEPRIKVLAHDCLLPHMSPAHLDRLEEIIETGKDQTSRACATNLLGRVRNEHARDVLRELLDDEERRVRFAALSSLVGQGEADFRDDLREMYRNADTNKSERDQILSVLMVNPADEDFPLLAEAMTREEVDHFLKISLAYTLGQEGDASVISSLEKARDDTIDANLKNIVDRAIAAINERESAKVGP